MENEIQVVRNTGVVANRFADMGFDVSVDMTSAQTQFCSMVAETDADRANMFNAMNNPDKRLADCINMTIKAKDLYIEVVNCTNEETGEITSVTEKIRIEEAGGKMGDIKEFIWKTQKLTVLSSYCFQHLLLILSLFSPLKSNL